METRTLNVVIAEENKQMQEMFLKHFKDNEKIELAAIVKDGKELLSEIITSCPDIVIMDLIMKEKDGFSILKEVGQLNLKSKPKFLVLTALNSDTFVTEALKLGASFVMAKPFDFETLEERIINVADNCFSGGNVNIKSLIKSDEARFLPVIKDSKIRALEEKITNIFITVGIPAHIKGYQFLREAIKMAVSSPEIINSITKKLYPNIADLFSTSPSKVERAIRHAIEVAWNRGKIENINALFGVKVYSNTDKPTNGEFIALVADKMLLEGA